MVAEISAEPPGRNASARNAASSRLWTFALPVAGEAEAARPAYRSRAPAGQDFEKPQRDEGPGTHVLRLLLHPDDLLRAAVPRQRRPQRLGRKRIQLLDAQNRRAPVLALFARRMEVVVDLAAAEQNLLDRAPVGDLGVVEERPERAGVSCSSGENEAGSRSRLFGVKSTSGRAWAWRTCRRSR